MILTKYGHYGLPNWDFLKKILAFKDGTFLTEVDTFWSIFGKNPQFLKSHSLCRTFYNYFLSLSYAVLNLIKETGRVNIFQNLSRIGDRNSKKWYLGQ